MKDRENDNEDIKKATNDHHEREIDIITIVKTVAEGSLWRLLRDNLDAFLNSLSKEYVYRVKGFLEVEGSKKIILNWAFVRYTLTKIKRDEDEMKSDRRVVVKITVMGQELGMLKRTFMKGFDVESSEVTFNFAKRLD